MKTSNKLLLGLLIIILLVITVTIVVAKIELQNGSFISKDVTHNDWSNDQDKPGSFNETKKSLSLDKFNALEVEGKIHVNYTQDNTQSVAVRASGGLDKYLVSQVRDGKLYLYTTRDLDDDERIYVDITIDSINGIQLSKGGVFKTMRKMQVARLNCEGSSGGVFEIEGNFTDLDFEISSGCVANLKGKCRNLDVDGSSGVVFNANDLEALIGKCSGSSGAVMTLNVTSEISVDASSGSVINCRGNARVKDIDISSGAHFSN